MHFEHITPESVSADFKLASKSWQLRHNDATVRHSIKAITLTPIWRHIVTKIITFLTALKEGGRPH